MVAPSSITREYIYGRSFTSWFFWWVLKLGKGILARRDVIAPRGPQILVFPPPNLGACTADRWEHAGTGWTMVTLTPPPPPIEKPKARPKRIMLYFYGSGFHRACHPRQWAFASYMAEKLDAETSVVPYPLVPLNNGKEVIPVLEEVYRAFLERADGREIIVLADSGGGHVALCLLYRVILSTQRAILPHQLILISPNLNSETNNPDMFSIAPNDPARGPEHVIRVNRLWAGGDPALPVSPQDAADPTINPFSGDVKLLAQRGATLAPGVPGTDKLAENDMRVTFVSAGWDILHADALLWIERAEEAGLNVHYIEGVKQVHDFPTGRKLIWEGRVATDMVVRNVRENSRKLGFDED